MNLMNKILSMVATVVLSPLLSLTSVAEDTSSPNTQATFSDSSSQSAKTQDRELDDE